MITRYHYRICIDSRRSLYELRYTNLRRLEHQARLTGPSQPQLCRGKRCYTTRQEAETVKTEQEIIDPELTLSIYQCLGCGTYHLTRLRIDK